MVKDIAMMLETIALLFMLDSFGLGSVMLASPALR